MRDCVVTCGFGTSGVDNQLKSQIIQGCGSDTLRRDASEKESISLADLLKMGKTTEIVDVYLKSAYNRRDSASEGASSDLGINRLQLDRSQIQEIGIRSHGLTTTISFNLFYYFFYPIVKK